jgi:excisionase family DNA binding protein
MNLDSAMRDLVREVIKDELRPLQEALRDVAAAADRRLHVDQAQPDDLLTVEQVAETLKVAEATVRGWIRAGALRASRPGAVGTSGRVYRVWRSDLEAFVLGGRGP